MERRGFQASGIYAIAKDIGQSATCQYVTSPIRAMNVVGDGENVDFACWEADGNEEPNKASRPSPPQRPRHAESNRFLAQRRRTREGVPFVPKMVTFHVTYVLGYRSSQSCHTPAPSITHAFLHPHASTPVISQYPSSRRRRTSLRTRYLPI